MIAISQTPNPTKFQKTLGVNDYYWGADDCDFPLGHIQMLGKTDARHPRGRARPWFAPGWRSTRWPRTRSTSGSRPRTCPHPDNRVTVDRQGRSTSRRPTTTTRRTGGCSRKLKGLLGTSACHDGCDPDAGRSATSGSRSPASRTSAAPCASATDPATSALDVNCKAHDVDNLYVVDTSFFPSTQRGEPGADRDGERPAGRRPPARAARREPRGRAARTQPRARRWRHELDTLARTSARASSPASSAPRR